MSVLFQATTHLSPGERVTYPLTRGMGGPQSCTGRFGEEKIIFPCQKSNYGSSGHSIRSPVTIMNMFKNVIVHNPLEPKLIPRVV